MTNTDKQVEVVRETLRLARWVAPTEPALAAIASLEHTLKEQAADEQECSEIQAKLAATNEVLTARISELERTLSVSAKVLEADTARISSLEAENTRLRGILEDTLLWCIDNAEWYAQAVAENIRSALSQLEEEEK